MNRQFHLIQLRDDIYNASLGQTSVLSCGFPQVEVEALLHAEVEYAPHGLTWPYTNRVSQRQARQLD